MRRIPCTLRFSHARSVGSTTRLLSNSVSILWGLRKKADGVDGFDSVNAETMVGRVEMPDYLPGLLTDTDGFVSSSMSAHDGCAIEAEPRFSRHHAIRPEVNVRRFATQAQC